MLPANLLSSLRRPKSRPLSSPPKRPNAPFLLRPPSFSAQEFDSPSVFHLRLTFLFLFFVYLSLLCVKPLFVCLFVSPPSERCGSLPRRKIKNTYRYSHSWMLQVLLVLDHYRPIHPSNEYSISLS